MNEVRDVRTVSLRCIEGHRRSDLIVSRLKQRTLLKNIDLISRWAGSTPIVVYDQDPWEAFRDGSPYKGAYDTFRERLNVRTFALTTRWWCDHLAQRGYPTTFVRMGLLPQYCSAGQDHGVRRIGCGFIGALHPYRRTLFERLSRAGIDVVHESGGLSYGDYLGALSRIRVFVHSEDVPITIDGEPFNLDVGLWIKDVEALARGCFSIRNRGKDSESYVADLQGLVLYDDPNEVPSLLSDIEKTTPDERQAIVASNVRVIEQRNEWLRTAMAMVSERWLR